MVVLVTNRKGGVGKTTIAMNLAYICHLLEKKTILLDCDLDQWDAYYFSTGDDNPESGKIVKSKFGYDICWIFDIEDIKAITSDLMQYDTIVIDGRPSGVIAAIFIKSSDIIIAPYITAIDGRQTARFRKMAKQINPGVKFIAIRNKSKKGIEYKKEFELMNPIKSYKYIKIKGIF